MLLVQKVLRVNEEALTHRQRSPSRYRIREFFMRPKAMAAEHSTIGS